MKTQTDNLIMGYMDGELSLGEVAQMDAKFTEAERIRMQSEIKFEPKLLDALGTKLCPDELWNKTLKMVSAEESVSKHTNITKFVSRPVTWLALAASITILLGSFQMTRASSEFLNPVTTIAALCSGSCQIPVEQLLADNNIKLSIAAASPDNMHSIEILGGCNCKINGEQITIINFSCCGEPQRVLIAHINGKATKAMLRKKNFKNIQIMDKRGNYQLALIGKHPGQEVLSLFREV